MQYFCQECRLTSFEIGLVQIIEILQSPDRIGTFRLPERDGERIDERKSRHQRVDRGVQAALGVETDIGLPGDERRRQIGDAEDETADFFRVLNGSLGLAADVEET